jgi:hypothetical protein
VGHYCPGGDPEPIPCRNNSYVNYTGAVQCEPCPAGFYCVIAGTTVICPEGESKGNNVLLYMAGWYHLYKPIQSFQCAFRIFNAQFSSASG